MDTQLLAVLKPTYDAIQVLKETPTCRNVGELQVTLRRNIEAFGDFLQPLHNYVTAVFVQSRIDYVESLTENEFICLARGINPSLFEAQLLNDCDANGTPVYEGAVADPVVSNERNSKAARRKFVERVGMALVDIAPVDGSAITLIESTLSELIEQHGKSLIESYKVVAEKRASQPPMMMHIPRM